ncbi:hypothetical protein MMC31_003696 [Peltigera leucophlebia]|nr:hypothetical protein [Peltigera leucophlebia]
MPVTRAQSLHGAANPDRADNGLKYGLPTGAPTRIPVASDDVNREELPPQDEIAQLKDMISHLIKVQKQNELIAGEKLAKIVITAERLDKMIQEDRSVFLGTLKFISKALEQQPKLDTLSKTLAGRWRLVREHLDQSESRHQILREALRIFYPATHDRIFRHPRADVPSTELCFWAITDDPASCRLYDQGDISPA